MKTRLNYCGLLAGAALACALLAAPAQAQERIKFKAIGQPLATGLIQKNKEQPFFETLAQQSGLPIEVEYKPVDTLGIKGHRAAARHESGPLRDGVAAHVAELARRADDSRTGPRRPESRLQDRQGGCAGLCRHPRPAPAEAVRRQAARYLAVRPTGILSARSRSPSSATSRVIKVRVYDQNLAKFVESLGGTRYRSLSLKRTRAVAGRRRLRDHRPELGQLRRMARSDDALAAAGFQMALERLWRMTLAPGTSSSPTSRPS